MTVWSVLASFESSGYKSISKNISSMCRTCSLLKWLFSHHIQGKYCGEVQVGLQYLTGEIVGGNARCIAMLMALRSMILDYTTPAEKTLVRDLMARINNNVNFFITCRQVHQEYCTE
jgi:hypothetical protein